MKWNRKKPSSASSSRPSFISHVFPTSWLTKFKQMSIDPGHDNKKMNQKGKRNSVSPSPKRCASGRGEGRFHGGDGDAFWRLSFGDDSFDGKNRRGVLRSVQYNSENEPEFPLSSCQSCRSDVTKVNRKEDTFQFGNMVSEIRKMKGLPREVEILPEMDTYMREKVAEIRTPRLRVEKEKKLRKTGQKIFEEKPMELNGEPYEAEGMPRKVVVQNTFDPEPGKRSGIVEREDCKLTASDSWKDCNISSMISRDYYLSKIEEDCVFASQKESDGSTAENFNSEWQKLKELKIEELKSRSEKQRKSLYISRELQRKRPKHNSKVRAYSPRTASKVEICRIKAFEDMKKAKLKMKKKAKEKTMEGLTGLESFAVVKSSFDPQKDFRDSMIEMIKEKRIRGPEELEELLACYLTLNSDEYHDLIIKVFRQVWFDLNQACFDTGLENEQCYCG